MVLFIIWKTERCVVGLGIALAHIFTQGNTEKLLYTAIKDPVFELDSFESLFLSISAEEWNSRAKIKKKKTLWKKNSRPIMRVPQNDRKKNRMGQNSCQRSSPNTPCLHWWGNFFLGGGKTYQMAKKNETDETSLLDNSSFIICSRAKGKHNGQESQKN